eukprot:jgi/Mesvir1/7472/Mv19236-RA.1
MVGQSCLASHNITRIAFVGDSLMRERIQWWWWFMDHKVDLKQLTLAHYDFHATAGKVQLSWFFDPLGRRLLTALLAATRQPCLTKPCPLASYGGVRELASVGQMGSANAPLDLSGFDVVVLGYGIWVCAAPPSALAMWDKSMAELARQLTFYKSKHPTSPKLVWVHTSSEVPSIKKGCLIDPLGLGLIRDIADRHMRYAPVSIVDGYDVSRGRETTAGDQRHYIIKERVAHRVHAGYFCTVERETSELILEALCG